MKITYGFEEAERAQVAELYWGAFGTKLGMVMGPTKRALPFIENVLNPQQALCARRDTGELIGVAGFKTHSGALVSGSLQEFTQYYGKFSAMWRTRLIEMLEQDTENERFLMDGLFVCPTARGHGVGTALLRAVCDEARRRGREEVRLDVIDDNPRARALYLREGFRAQKTHRLGMMRFVFGFRSVTAMTKRV